jgi:orotate phosphoribosyltransferase
MTREEVLELFRETGVLQEGHFLLSSGNHSARYLQCALVLQYPWHAERLVQPLAKAFRKADVDVVAAPALGGILVGYELARALQVRFLFAEREEGHMRFRRGLRVEPGERVLVAEDVVTTGGSVQEVLDCVREAEGIPIGVAAIVDRSGGKVNFGVPFHAVIALDVEHFPPDDCPLCQQGLPIIKPGSRKR